MAAASIPLTCSPESVRAVAGNSRSNGSDGTDPRRFDSWNTSHRRGGYRRHCVFNTTMQACVLEGLEVIDDGLPDSVTCCCTLLCYLLQCSSITSTCHAILTPPAQTQHMTFVLSAEAALLTEQQELSIFNVKCDVWAALTLQH